MWNLRNNYTSTELNNTVSYQGNNCNNQFFVVEQIAALEFECQRSSSVPRNVNTSALKLLSIILLEEKSSKAF